MLTDSIFTTIFVNLDVNYRQFKYDFVFALMKCSYAAFGEQNKTDNDSKCYSRHIYLRFSGCVI